MFVMSVLSTSKDDLDSQIDSEWNTPQISFLLLCPVSVAFSFHLLESLAKKEREKFYLCGLYTPKIENVGGRGAGSPHPGSQGFEIWRFLSSFEAGSWGGWWRLGA